MLSIVFLFLPLMLLLIFLVGVFMFIDVAFHEHRGTQHRDEQIDSQHAVSQNGQ